MTLCNIDGDGNVYEEGDDSFCDYCGGPMDACYCDDCPECHGTGVVYPDGYYEGDGSITCPECNGEGEA